jgi:DNA-binding NarL/FixJ family response regulator
VDDCADVNEVVRMLVESDPTLRWAGSLESADRLNEAIRGMKPPPDVVILDASMPGKDPLLALRAMTAEFPRVRAVIYSGHNDAGAIGRAMNAGAWGCVSKSEEPEAILRAVHEVAAGNVCWPGSSAGAR